MSQIIGHISQVIGPVVDVYFEGTDAEVMLPSIHDALEIKRPNGKILIVEVQQHIGENTVRTVAMDSTDGLQRGMKVYPTGGPITMPIGEQIKGRLMNVVGDSIDGMKAERCIFHSPRSSQIRRFNYRAGGTLYGYQGDRLARTVCQRW